MSVRPFSGSIASLSLVLQVGELIILFATAHRLSDAFSTVERFRRRDVNVPAKSLATLSDAVVDAGAVAEWITELRQHSSIFELHITSSSDRRWPDVHDLSRGSLSGARAEQWAALVRANVMAADTEGVERLLAVCSGSGGRAWTALFDRYITEASDVELEHWYKACEVNQHLQDRRRRHLPCS